MPDNEQLKVVLVLASNPQQITQVEGFLERLNNQLHLDEVQYNKLLVATTEAVNNGIIHGNKRDPAKKVTLTCVKNHATLIIRVDDEGSGVDPGALPDPLAEENLLRENGRGVFLMRSLMEKVEFEKTAGGAAVVMKMNIEK
ncbi:MAG: ATP-binding protein [Ignavibacteria bacterium]|nr:ATP-binding protein [Ignavibacteria bacterium]MBI3765777.1 ATP-binding protein [Ignavibacteriales bacterium]